MRRRKVKRRLSELEVAEIRRINLIMLESNLSQHKSELRYCLFKVEQSEKDLRWWVAAANRHRKGLKSVKAKIARRT